MQIDHLILFIYGVGLIIAIVLLIAVLIKRLKEKKEEDFEKRDY